MDFNEYAANSASTSLWEEMYDFNLADLITEARLHAGLTQDQLAKRLGTKQPSVARVENGSVLPSHQFLKRVARAIGTKLLAPRFEFMDKEEQISFASTSMSTQDDAYVPIVEFSKNCVRNINVRNLSPLVTGNYHSHGK